MEGGIREQNGTPFLSGSNMSSDEDEPAPSPSAAVVARRASREAKSMREESGSDEDAEEPEDWEDDGGEASSEEDESDEEVRVSNAQRGRVRLHRVSQSANGLEVDDDRRKSLGEKGWARRAVVVRGVEPSGAADFEAVPGREEYDLGVDGSAAWAQDMLEFADDNFNDAGIEVRSMDKELSDTQTIHAAASSPQLLGGVDGRMLDPG